MLLDGGLIEVFNGPQDSIQRKLAGMLMNFYPDRFGNFNLVFVIHLIQQKIA